MGASPIMLVDLDGEDIINADKIHKEEQYRLLKVRAEEFISILDRIAASQINGTKRKDFIRQGGQEGRNLWREYKRGKKNLDRQTKETAKAEAAFQNTQKAIEDFKNNTPFAYEEMNSAMYKGNKIDIYVTSRERIGSGNMGVDQEGAQTIFVYQESQDRFFMPLIDYAKRESEFLENAVKVRMGIGADGGRKLAHEIGHIFGALDSPVDFTRSTRENANKSCQNYANQKILHIAPAIRFQKEYEAVKKTGQPNLNFKPKLTNKN
jgi:hypothetical protein